MRKQAPSCPRIRLPGRCVTSQMLHTEWAIEDNLDIREKLKADVARQTFLLQEYAAVGDGKTLALIAPDGAVAWWCVPDLDSPPLFDSLLDSSHGGFCTLQPVEGFHVERQYRENSNVLETVFTTASGAVRVTEALLH